MNFAPLTLHVLIATVGIIAAIRTPAARRPKLLPIYLAFVALAGIAGGIVFGFAPPHYRSLFWVLEFTHNLILCSLALQIIADVLPRRFATPWALFFLTSLLFSIARQWPMLSTPALLNLSISTLATAGLLLVALVFVPDIEWPRGYAMAAIGLAAVLAGNLLPSVQWINGAVSPTALQFGDVPGLIVLSGSEAWRKVDQLTHWSH